MLRNTSIDNVRYTKVHLKFPSVLKYEKEKNSRFLLIFIFGLLPILVCFFVKQITKIF